MSEKTKQEYVPINPYLELSERLLEIVFTILVVIFQVYRNIKRKGMNTK